MKAVSAVTMVALVLTPLAATAADAPPGATACSGCHGGALAAASPIPSINGRPAGETAAAMAAFRSGERPSTVMDRIAKGFTEDETRLIADWLAAQR